jgi:ribosomal protein L40E
VYYTSPQKQAYVQPIYYFECTGSERDFYGVVPAIKGEYLEPRQDDHEELMAWIMCRECGAKYQIRLKQWHAVAQGHVKENPDSRTPPPLVCQQCGEKTAYRAIKCEKCGLIFEAGWKGPDYYDRCPQCNFSQVEERMKERESRPKR